MRTEAEAHRDPVARSSSSWRWIALAAVVLFTTAARLWLIRHYPEPDGDAKGHLGIAHYLLSHPLNVAAHWVWPPGYHYILAALLAVGVTGDGVRLINCALAALLPFLVWRYAERTLEPGTSATTRLAPFLAAVLFAVMPVVNLLGTSAQQETLFTILVLGTAWSIDTGRFARAGLLLAVAVMIRFEAGGAVGLLLGLLAAARIPAIARRLPASLARAGRLPLVTVVPSLVAIGGWLLAHRLSDGSFFGFIREIHRYTELQRESFHQDRWHELLWFPIKEPYYLFGLTLPLVVVGVRRAWRVGFVVPLGIYLFLLASYASKSALGHARYYESLTPFVCIAAARGATAIGERWRLALPLSFTAAFAHLAWLLVLMGRWTFHV